MIFFDMDAVLARIKKTKGIKKDREVAPLLGLSPQDFSNRKKRGTLRAPIVEWAAREGLNVSWILTGQDEMRAVAARKAPEGHTGARTGAEAAACPFPPQLTPIEWSMLVVFRGLTKDQQEDKVVEIGALAARNEPRTEEGGGSDSAGKKSA